MKEHPDYKYRPRRKPKSLVKKENKFGFTLSPLNMTANDTLSSISRSLIPSLAPSINHPIINQEDFKIPRLFHTFPYHVYPIQHKITEDFNGGKIATDLAIQVLYFNILYTRKKNYCIIYKNYSWF